ncbi:hypothetical protein [Macrococcus carouselicus]|uniref:Uncharacterized protein n=1 Tax=Macrococcus carouselicus TaxID=69969 RepID=A0A9Q8FK59_9STAP|nr:hypothetical protein [Macrococcus carouselicus]TDL95543.1 hypothetical protein ERX40_10190 [Macrococcus carouselicus]
MIKINKDTIKKLIDDYKILQNPKTTTVNKYSGNYNNVRISIYFDAWDQANYNFQLLLVYEKQYYLVNLRIIDANITSRFLPDLPVTLQRQIIVEGTLNAFYEQVEHIINNNKRITLNIERDTTYIKARKYSPCTGEMFLKGLTHKNMTSKMMIWIEKNTNIKKEDIEKVKRVRKTFVRTDDINLRKKIDIILRDNNIQ